MKRFLVLFVLSLAACSSPEPTHPPGGGIDLCLENPYGSAATPLIFDYGESIMQPTGQRWYKTLLPAAGNYKLVLNNIPLYDGFGTAFYQDDPVIPSKATYTDEYVSELSVPIEAEAGVVLFYISHIVPLNEVTCDRYTFRLETQP